MTDTLTAWQCIGCGRLESPQPCIGVCQDRKVELVLARDYQAALARAQAAEAALGLARKLARTNPRGDRWRDAYLAFQDEARRLLAEPREGNDKP